MSLTREPNGELAGECVHFRIRQREGVYLYAGIDQLCASLSEARAIHAELTELFKMLDENL